MKEERYCFFGGFVFIFTLLLGMGHFFSPYSYGKESSQEKAIRLFTRLAGIRLGMDDPRLAQMVSLIDDKKYIEAAQIATADRGFYNLTVFQFFAPKSVRDESYSAPLNDFIAMGIANTMLKDENQKDFPYTNLLEGDFTVQVNETGLPARVLTDNKHYEAVTQRQISLTDKNLQIITPQRPNFPDAAGALTSRQFMLQHAIAGTNRRWVQYAFRNFLCSDIKEWRDGDPTLSDVEVTRDISRAPGGDAARYQTECRACHQLQDSMRRAVAYHDFDSAKGVPVYQPGVVRDKINSLGANAQTLVFAGGFVVPDDQWENRATRNHNMKFGWRGDVKGKGAKPFGAMIARAQRFSTCAVEQAWELICRKKPEAFMKPTIETLGKNFEKNGYSLRGMMEEVSVTPGCIMLEE